MLRIVQTSNSANAKSYFKGMHLHEDAYTGPERAAGVWQGKLAGELGLAGKVRERQWASVCDNRHPESGESLTSRNRADRTVAYDFNFNCPKSVSVVAALGGDRDVEPAMVAAMRETMAEVEQDASTRVRRAGQSQDRSSGNLLWGEYIHRTARPVKGYPDMHLHGHCFVFNVTHDPVEEMLKAVQFRGLVQDALYYETRFLSRLAQKLIDLGYQIETKGRFWEIAGVPERLITEFSQRTDQVDRAAAKKGIRNPNEKAGLAAKTREPKNEDLTDEQLAANWKSRTQSGDEALLGSLRGTGGLKGTHRSARDIATHAMGRVFERTAVVTERRLLSEALRLCWDVTRIPELKAEFERQGVLRKEHEGRVMVTTQEVLREEQRMVELALEGRGRFRPLRDTPVPEGTYSISSDQLTALNHVVQSTDPMTIIEGPAGTGKTRLLQALNAEIEASMGVAGKLLDRLIVLAPTSDASRGVLKDEGFADATTVAKFLADTDGMSLVRKGAENAVGRIVYVDEAGLLGTSSMVALQERCRSMGARMVLSCSQQQLNAVARGGIVSTLKVHAGLGSAKLQEIQRQKGPYLEAVKAFSTGRAAEGFSRLNAMGAIDQVNEDAVARCAAVDYVETVKVGKTAMVIAPTHAEGDAVTSEVRSVLKADKRLGKERTLEQLKPVESTAEDRRRPGLYKRGQVVQFHQNASGFKAGSRWNVEGHDPFGNVVVRSGFDIRSVPLSKAERFEVFEKASIDIAVGDLVRITKNGKTFSVAEAVFNEATGAKRFPKRDLNNGSIHRVKRFTKDGGLHLENNLIVPKDYGHVTHGYCSTTFAAQGKTVDRVILCQTAASGRAGSQEQFYSSITRGRESVAVYTENKERLRSVVSRSSRPLGAMDLIHSNGTHVSEGIKMAREQDHAREHTKSNEPRKDGLDRG